VQALHHEALRTSEMQPADESGFIGVVHDDSRELALRFRIGEEVARRKAGDVDYGNFVWVARNHW
jgi:hypothetical protein